MSHLATTEAPAVRDAIANLRTAVPDITGVLVASVDGLPVADDMPMASSDSVAAMAATAAGLGKRIVEDFEFGDFAESVVRASGGYFIVYSIGRAAVLAVLAKEEANLGRVHLQARRCVSAVAEHLSGGSV